MLFYIGIIMWLGIIGGYGLNLVSSWLTIKHSQKPIPSEFKSAYKPDDYKKSQHYIMNKTWLAMLTETAFLLITIAVILGGGFNQLDQWISQLQLGPIATGCLYLGSLALATMIINLPFDWYRLFVIEQHYGFNTTTIRTFILDKVKSVALLVIIGWPLLAGILMSFQKAGAHAWLWCWLIIVSFQLVMMVIAPIVIMPLFNRFEPIPDGALKDAIMTYCKNEQFKLSGIYTMDGSRRSRHTNAFFTGIGRFRRIVLYDTLIDKSTTNELVAILAHEMGHYRRKHIHKGLFLHGLTSGLMFAMLGIIQMVPELVSLIGISTPSIHAALVLFGFIYAPFGMILGIIANYKSRQYEFEADEYAIKTSPEPDALISGLKALTIDNLSNLNPHPFTVALTYTHPPVVQRIKAIQKHL